MASTATDFTLEKSQVRIRGSLLNQAGNTQYPTLDIRHGTLLRRQAGRQISIMLRAAQLRIVMATA